MGSNVSSFQRQAQEAIRPHGDEKCPHHRGQNVVYKCTECNKLACMTCVTTLHRRHELDEISDIIPDIKVKIKSFIASIERNEIQKIQNKIKEVQADVSKNRKYYKNLIGDIKKQRDILMSQLDDITNGLIKSCRDLEQVNENKLLQYSGDLQTVIDELNAQISECKDALQSGNNVQIYDISNDIPSNYKDLPTPEMSLANFIPGKLELQKLKLILGELTIQRSEDEIFLEDHPQSNQPVSLKTLASSTRHGNLREIHRSYKSTYSRRSSRLANWSVVSQFTPYEGYQIVSMCAASNNQVWVCLNDSSKETFSNKLLLVDYKGNILKSLEMEVSILRLCLHPTSKNIWFVSDYDNKVREVTGSKSIVRFPTTGGALSVCISRESNIYIGQTGGIVLYTQTGDVLCRTIGGDTPLVRSPYNISLRPVSNKLAVVDWDCEEDGGTNEPRVVILSDTLQLLHQYHGDRPGQQSPEKPFNPYDVCYNRKGEVVITDLDNRSVTLLSKRGEYLQTLYTDSDSSIRAVCIQDNGDVFVSLLDYRMVVLRKIQN